jgi:hypothetical protein
MRLLFALTPMVLVGVLACGGGRHDPPPQSPSSNRVFVVVEENHSFSEVIGSADMPYFNSLATKYALATQYYADTHPSIGNYLMLTTGQIETADERFPSTISDDNVVRELVRAGKTWRAYAEDLPNAGYTGADVYPYHKGHNPFAYLSDVVGTSQANNIVPFSQFSLDLARGNLPDFCFIIPNMVNDAHDGSLAVADQWLQTNIAPLITIPSFQGGGLLVITFDEGDVTDTSHGGGQVATVVVGTRIKSGFRSTTFYQHESTLRLLLSTLGVNAFPGNAAHAADMREFFQ